MLNFVAIATLTLLLPSPTDCSTCSPGEVACAGICAKACDGIVECPNREDETVDLCRNAKCSTTQSGLPGDLVDLGEFGSIIGEAASEAGTKFKCAYGGCITASFICNGPKDCWDGSDETKELCANRACKRSRDVRCAYGACIRRLWMCDGRIQCYDGSDETAERCKNFACSPGKFKCDYGGCIDQRKKCDGKPDCHDSSDETKALCGPNHVVVGTVTKRPSTPPPVTQPPPPVVTQPPPPPVTQPPPRVVTQPPVPVTPPVTPDIIVPEPDPPKEMCTNQGLCPCPHPNMHFCVPCNDMESCARINEQSVCRIDPAGGPDSRVTVDVLSCGTQPQLHLAGLVRNHEEVQCGVGRMVPVLSVVTADCWGTTILAQCRSDGLWHPYGGISNNTTPVQHLCQFKDINSPVCGIRPPYYRRPDRIITYAARPKWPWLVGLRREGQYKCTATIVTPHYLITAAHCLASTQETSTETIDVRDVRIQRLNHHGSLEREYVTQVHLYPGYKGGRQPANDLALVKVEQEILFSKEVYPACVLNQAFPRDKLAATFSRTNEDYHWEEILQQYDDRCYSPLDRCSNELRIKSDQFCAIDTASQRFLPQGSSGGPYLVNMGTDARERWTVAGIVSSSRNEANCPSPYTIFTATHHFWEWINKCINTGVCT